MQQRRYIGIKDQSGRKIHEGDRVRALTYWGFPIDYPREIIGDVVFRRGSYCIDGDIQGCRSCFPVYDCWKFELLPRSCQER